MYKRSKYGKLPAMVAQEISWIKILVDQIDCMHFKNPNIRYPEKGNK